MNTLVKRNKVLFPEWPLFDDFLVKDVFRNVAENLEATSLPAVNIKDNEKSFELEVVAPGLNKEDFKIELENEQLVISAQREEKNEDEKDGKYSRREYKFSSFKRSFTLPTETTDAENISAKYNNGVLLVSIPKKEKVKQLKQIDIA